MQPDYDTNSADYQRFIRARPGFSYALWAKLPEGSKQFHDDLIKNDPAALSTERGKQHGDWLDQSALFCQLLGVMIASQNWSQLPAYKVAALLNMQQKISRILTGDPSVADHWDDIAGYAYLGKGGHTK